METKSIWLVQAHATDSLRSHYAFDSEEKARNCYKEVVKTLKNHKPHAANRWTYKLVFEEDSDISYAIFEGHCDIQDKTFSVFYQKLDVK